ncbi:hypothetical protein acsn021_05810 [Anaerocolumna cellulosilytica]|uniref:Uncharacterized protein n=1 Tax=Anaerocolumna cellulosilytica TaxID=433286 RepID=A0A6S6R0D1_9FIRM|nr:hypothetical protein [Anaerocolumna cellulosilytica]MBB5197776.1 hypothetical protein [Anaerocolumna cellulosilytica]BCJ93012.1 hypothetical protein acsn021_05810 [Anaerocolumna cellulosilytica]
MKKTSKWMVFLLCLVLFATMAMGCDSSESGETKDIVTSEKTESSGDETTNDVAEEAKAPSDAAVTIEKQVLVDQNDIVITADEYTTDDIWGDGIKLLIENNSDKNVTVGTKAIIVNNYMITDIFIAEVAAGKKSNETMYLSSTSLEAAGIDSVGQIEIYFHVYDSASYDDILNTEVVTIQTSEYANMDTTTNDAGTELYNEGGIRIVGKTVDENSFWGTAILLYMENTSGTNAAIECENMSINGFMMSPFFSCNVYDGKKSINEITIMSSELEENGIESIDEVELQFNIYEAETFETIAVSDPIKFTAK